MDVDFDPTTLDNWAQVDDVCPVETSVAIGDATLRLRCEYDAGHEPPHGGTLLWSEGPAET